MNETTLIRQRIRTPRAAAIAGIVFSLLLITSLLLIWTSIPSNPLTLNVVRHSRTITFALNLMSFSGIAFLWFIAVVRDRLGELEDRFFATVFLGSGVLFIAMIFLAASLAGGLLTVLENQSTNLVRSGTYDMVRVQVSQVMHIYAMKMAAVFMSSTSAISVRTGIFPRWMAVLGFVLAILLLLSVTTIEFAPLHLSPVGTADQRIHPDG